MSGKRFEFRSLIRPRVRVCRHCGRKFTANCAASKTCNRPECVAWSKARRKEQVKANLKRFRARQQLIKNGTH